MRKAFAILVGAAGLVLSVHACVGSDTDRNGPGTITAGSGPAGGGSFDKSALLANLGEQLVILYGQVADAADRLASATDTYAGSLDPADREAAQQAWREAMVLWQRAELTQLGPTGPMGSVLAGEDLRDEIYSWPLVNPCRIDQELVAKSYEDTDQLASALINLRGLDALEYLLFHDGPGNACAATVSINKDGSWDAIAPELAQRRADYARAAAAVLAQDAAALRDRWSSSGGNFVAELATPGAVYDDVQHALNAVSDALFYLDLKTKDAKLAIPAGLANCTTDVCPGELESKYAGFSKQEIVANLEGFRLVFLGGPPGSVGLGFDDLLIALGQLDHAASIADAIQGAIDAADAIEEDDLADALANDPESVRDLYFAVKKVTDSLKSEFVSVLDLRVPKTAEGDND